MHDRFNTCNGDIGFVATFEDGTHATELESTWSEVSVDKRITRLALVGFLSGAVELLSLTGYELYFFVNEAIASLAGGRELAAKIFVGVRDGKADIVRVNIVDGPSVQRASCDAADLPFSANDFRLGITAADRA